MWVNALGEGGRCTTVYLTWRSKNSLQETGSGNLTQVTRLGSKQLYPMSHLTVLINYSSIWVTDIHAHTHSHILKKESCYVTLTSLKLFSLLFQPPGFWDYKHTNLSANSNSYNLKVILTSYESNTLLYYKLNPSQWAGSGGAHL